MPSKLHHLSKLHLHPLPPQHYSPLLKPFLTAKGAHAPPPVRVPPDYSIMGFDHKPSFFLVFLLVSLHFVASSGLTDSEILLKFKDSLSNASALSDWSDKTTPCTKNNATNWVGVICVNGILWGLQLENMGLAGKIDLETLQAFPDLKTLSIMNNNFDGNKGLCGPPLKECNTTTSNSDSKKPPVLRIVIIAAVVGLLLGAIVAAFLFLLRRRRQRQPSASIEAPPPPIPSNLKKKTGFKEENQSPSSSPDSKKGEAPKLSFVRDDRERFDLPDLLKASAEILGSGCFGSSYRAALSSGTMMVVKRFKQMNNVGKEEFQEHMRRLGRLKHSNLLPLVAYYYRKEEKLLITDFVEKGNLAVHLHDHQALGLPSLDWPSRLKIVKGVASGLAYLYRDLPNIIAAHGHLKSSNVLLTQSNDPLLTDYGLVPVINQENAQELMVAYKSPEYLHHGRITKKTDVWSLGMLILEILTAKLPANFVPQGKGSEEELDLAKWASSVPREEWANVVIDKEMTGGPARQIGGGESEVIKLLKIGMSCCEADVEKRIDLKGAVERIEEIKERDGDDDFLSSYASEGDMRASIGKSDEITFS
ncbi:hypothetical protein OIU78_003319 [Salix suchowensis]|nr:hypothetical protein OIU78_003319 [Salix suchowensis]